MSITKIIKLETDRYLKLFSIYTNMQYTSLTTVDLNQLVVTLIYWHQSRQNNITWYVQYKQRA